MPIWRLTITTAGITVRDLGSTNATLLDGEAVDPDGAFVIPGQLLRLGESLLCIAGADEPAAAVRAGPDGARLVNRPPRLSALLPEREIVAPTRPSASGPQRIQWLAALLPTSFLTSLVRAPDCPAVTTVRHARGSWTTRNG